MPRNPYYKVNGVLQGAGGIDPYIFQTPEELAEVPESDEAQAALILGEGDGATLKVRLPGGEWTEV